MARVLQNTAGYLAPRVLSGLREASRDYIEHRGEIMLGLSLALRGALASTRRQGLRAFSAFGAEYAAYTAGLYALAICVGLTILAPVSLLLFFLYPTGECGRDGMGGLRTPLPTHTHTHTDRTHPSPRATPHHTPCSPPSSGLPDPPLGVRHGSGAP